MSQLREELLISRVIDGDASPAEWDELQRLADVNPAVWNDLAETLRDHKAFARGMESAVCVADAIDMPSPKAASFVEPSPIARIGRWGLHWTGWAIAAGLLLTWIVGWYQPVPPMSTSKPRVEKMAGAPVSLDEFLQQGRDNGQIVGVPDRVLVDQRPAPDGNGVELLYMQPILLREHVPDAYKLGPQDELGRPSLVKYERPLDNRPPM